jgi:hypothetical protein
MACKADLTFTHANTTVHQAVTMYCLAIQKFLQNPDSKSRIDDAIQAVEEYAQSSSMSPLVVQYLETAKLMAVKMAKKMEKSGKLEYFLEDLYRVKY